MADKNIGKITQVIGAVLDLKFSEGYLPEINDAVEITRKDGGKLVVEVAQHLGDDIVRCIAMGTDRRTGARHGRRSNRGTDFSSGWRSNTRTYLQRTG